jgi:hypothetical protein
MLLKNLLPRMVDDMFRIVLDPIFNHSWLMSPTAMPKARQPPHISKYRLPGRLFSESHKGYRDNENLFEHICNLNDF